MSDNIRDGNRGGRGLFSWEDVRVMSYKDRECYLGSTVNLGFLDKGGRWRKKDWWTKESERLTNEDLDEEYKRVREEDERRMLEALGGRSSKPPRKKSKLSNQDKTNLLSRRADEPDGIDKELQGHKVTGLGFDPANRLFGAKEVVQSGLTDEALRLEGYDNNKQTTPGHAKHRGKDYKSQRHNRK
mmetsp:Transcript_19792/g.36480  ORF Transcript_19792/g.36480 Transcript_19792/m.36480 type:complete len:186 (-) Transcript_19792:9070-9627(-)